MPKPLFHMKAASFNVNSIRARLDRVLAWLEKEAPDLLCLQETKALDADFPLAAIKGRGYNVIFRGEKSYNGVAMISRHPIEAVHIGFDKQEREGSRIITAVIKGIPVINTYVPQGYHPLSQKFQHKLQWFQDLFAYIDSNFDPESPLLWMGDFNVAPEPRDVYDPEKLLGQVGFHPDEHAALHRLKEWGFVDVFRFHESGPGHYSFWDYRVKNAVTRGRGWRIDHIWATKILAKKSVKAWIDVEERTKTRPSDHAPVLVEFKA